jgi:hypothetical protein
MSHLSVQTKLYSFLKPALLRSKASTNSDFSIDENMYRLLKDFNYRLYSNL